MTSEKRPQKLHTNDVLLLRSGRCSWLAEASFPRGTTNQKHNPDRGSDTTRHQYGISEVVPQTLFRGKPVVASTNVGCFLMLAFLLFLCLFCNADFTMQPIRRHYVQAKILILFFWLCSVTKKSCWKTPVFEASYRSLNAMKARYESSWPLWNRLLWLL